MKKVHCTLAAAAITLLATSFLPGASPAQQARISLVGHSTAPSGMAANSVADPSIAEKQLPDGSIRQAHVFAQSVKLGSPVTEVIHVAFNEPTTLKSIDASNDFHVAGGSCRMGQSYSIGATCSVAVTLDPKGPGQRAGQLTLGIAEAAAPLVVGLQGTTLGPVLSFVPAQITTLPQSLSKGAPVLYNPGDVIVDQGDNLYVSDMQAGGSNAAGLVYMLDSSNQFSVVLGGGNTPINTKGGNTPSNQIQLNKPWGIAADSFLDLYVAEWGGGTVDMVNQGLAYDIAGGGTQQAYMANCNTANPCKPLSMQFMHPTWLSVDNAQNLFIDDSAGFYTLPWSGMAPRNFITMNSFLATAWSGHAFAMDSADNIYAEYSTGAGTPCQIGGVNPNTNFTWTVAGSGPCGYSGNNVRGQNAEVAALVNGYAFDAAGDLFFNDWENNVLRRVDSYNGLIRTVAGNYALGGGYTGDGGPATDATLSQPAGVAVDSYGNIYTASFDYLPSLPNGPGYVIRQIGPAGQRNFPTQLVGKSSPVNTVLLTNTGNDSLSVSNQILGGANPGDFVPDAATSSCTWSSALAPGKSCQLGFSCKPTAAGLRTATVTFVDNTATFQNNLYLACYAIAAPITPTITINPPASGAQYYAGASVPVTVLVANSITGIPTPPTGTITLNAVNTTTSGKSSVGPLNLSPVAGQSQSTISSTLTSLPVGKYTVAASYSGDTLDTSLVSATVPFSIIQATPTVSITSPANNATILVSTPSIGVTVSNAAASPAAPAAPSGTVTVTVTSKATAASSQFTGTLTPGAGGVSTVSIPTSTLIAGTYTVSAAYGGDAIDAAATSSSITLTVVKLTAVETVTSPANGSSVLPGTVPVTVTVSNNGLTPTAPAAPTGTVYLNITSVGSMNMNLTASLVQGSGGVSTATFSIPNLAVAKYTLTPTYNGDVYDSPITTGTASTFNVVQLAPKVTVTSPTASTYNYGTAMTLTAQVSNAGLTPVDPSSPTGNVTFTVTNLTTNAKSTYGPYSLNTGSAGISSVSNANVTGLTAANYSITASYGGDSSDAAAVSPTVSFTIAKVVPTIAWATPSFIYTGAKLSATQLNATASALGAVLPGGFVYTPPSGTVESSAGTVTLKVVFTPTDTVNFTTNSSSVQLLVLSQVNDVPATTTTLASSQNPANIGQAVVLNAAVANQSGTVTPGGTVTLTENGKTLVTALLSGGRAKLNLAGLAPGTHMLTAMYGGDSKHQGSASAPLQQIIVSVGNGVTGIHSSE